MKDKNNELGEDKLTDIGVIPVDWDALQLELFVEINSGESPSKYQFVDEGIPYFKVEQLNLGSKYGEETPYRFAIGKTVKAGSIIFPKRGASILLNKIRILKNDSFMDTNLMTLTTNDKLVNQYLYYCLDYQGLSEIADTTSIPQINNKHINPFKIPVPSSKVEQTAIAKALSDVDVLITSLEKLITKKQAIKTATMQQLLTGKKRLPGFGEDWNIINIEKNASLKARIGWQALTTNEYLEQGNFYLVTGTDFVGGLVNWSTCHFVDEWRYKQDKNIQLKNNDILLTKDGTIGKVGFVDKLDEPATLNSGVFVIRPKEDSFYPLFLLKIKPRP